MREEINELMTSFIFLRRCGCGGVFYAGGEPLVGCMGFEVNTTLNITTAAFWDVTPCSLVDLYQCFKESATCI
jgi:hypothetical protein